MIFLEGISFGYLQTRIANLVCKIPKLHCCFCSKQPTSKTNPDDYVCVTSLLDNLGIINLVEKSASPSLGKAASNINISTIIRDVCAVHKSKVSGASASGFSPSRLPWPACPCQMLFLHLLVFLVCDIFKTRCSRWWIRDKSLSW